MKKNLYAWQEKCLECWFANQGRGIVQAATGSGKTFLALTAANRLEKLLNQELRVKIVVPTGALLRQWHQALRQFLINTNHAGTMEIQHAIGLRGSGFHMASDHKYMIYVINSARYELARQIMSDLKDGMAVLLIADECHRYESEQNRLIFEFLPHINAHENCFFSLGLSATLPSGQAQKYLTSVLGRKIYSYEIAQASALHTICQYNIFHIGLSFKHEENTEYQEMTERLSHLYRMLLKAHPFLRDMNQKERYEQLRVLTEDKNRKIAEAASLYIKLSYKRKSLVCLASARISCTCDLIEKLPDKEKILIFGERISQAEELYHLLQKKYQEKVGRYHSQMGQQANQNVLNRFRDGNIRILIACKSLDEGVDIPDATVGIILSGTSVQRQRIQRLGRIIRKKDGKGKAYLYYLHITESTEDAYFLPEANNCNILELEYHSDKHIFTNPCYDHAAAKLLDSLKRTETDAAKLAEVRRCLHLGSIRSDWLDNPNEIDRKIHEAKYISDKNYWICMKKMTVISQQQRIN